MKSLKLLFIAGVAMASLAAGPAKAVVITDSFTGFPTPNPFSQQDKNWANFVDVGGNLPTGFTTVVTTRSQIVPGQDAHTFSLQAAFSPNTTYEVSYDILVNAAGPIVISEASAGLNQTIPGAFITSTVSNGAFSLTIGPTTASGLVTVGPGFSALHVVDTVTTGSSDITGFANTFIEFNVPAPEPASLALLGAGLAGLGFVRRRRG